MLFYGTISHGEQSALPLSGLDTSTTPMHNPGQLVWAAEDIYKHELTVGEPQSEILREKSGFICSKLFLTVFFLPFLNAPIALFVLPWVLGETILVAFKYPAAVIIFILMMCLLVRPVFKVKYMSIEEMKEKIKEMRERAPCPTNKYFAGGPQCIDPVQI